VCCSDAHLFSLLNGLPFKLIFWAAKIGDSFINCGLQLQIFKNLLFASAILIVSGFKLSYEQEDINWIKYHFYLFFSPWSADGRPKD
ncbi:MAG: hypothetical protein ABIU30_03110, partial [Ferruginibacter sp.]